MVEGGLAQPRWRECWLDPEADSVRLETVCGGSPSTWDMSGLQLRSKIIIPPPWGLFGRVQWEADSTWVGG